jgi:hypothetical protein
MADVEVDELRERLEKYIGEPMGPPSVAPDAVNVPMIRHWVDALDDRNPVYLDEEAAAKSRFGGIVAPPAMLQAWTMPRPKIEGIAERGGAPDEITRPGDQLRLTTELESISPRKTTGLGQGYFVTWVTTFMCGDDDEVVGRQLFRILKFDPSTIDLSKLGGA